MQLNIISRVTFFFSSYKQKKIYIFIICTKTGFFKTKEKGTHFAINYRQEKHMSFKKQKKPILSYKTKQNNLKRGEKKKKQGERKL